LYAYRRDQRITYAALGLGAVTLSAALAHYASDFTSLGLILLAAAYFIPGFVVRIFRPSSRLANIFTISALTLATITSFYSLVDFDKNLYGFVPAAVAALLWTAEAFLRRNVYLGFPANLLYIMSFFILLYNLDVSEPQAYSIIAAMIGFLQYHMLVRAGKQQLPAFFTGCIAMLVLLGTTYIQMVSTEKLSFFALLFFQSLIILFYGILIRSRSLFGSPIFFVVIGVITVVLNILQGLSTVIIIGGTGIVMIAAGIVAVLMRERISKIGSFLSDWKA
jgi:hypothetical protein